MSLPSILNEAVNTISPTPEELRAADKAAKEVVSKLNKVLKPIGASAMVSGSARKGTQLKHTKEIDIFVQFDYKRYSPIQSTISEVLFKKLKRIYPKIIRLHGSRDYFFITLNPFVFEIIPILKVRSAAQAKNITDISPLHATWVASKGKNKQKDIRLLKAFLTANHLYGAESYVRGFSGYACEILIIHYGSFTKVLRATTKWKPKTVIDPLKVYKSKDPVFELNKSKTEGPLIIIDPVQASRNVCAAVNLQAFNGFKAAAKEFLRKPHVSAFEREYQTPQLIEMDKPKNTTALILTIIPKKNKPDVMGAVSLRRYERITDELSNHNFTVKGGDWQMYKDKALLWFYISDTPLDDYEVRKGPLVSQKDHARRFKAKHRKTYVKNRRLMAKVKRPYKTPMDVIKFVTSQKTFKHKISKFTVTWF